MMSEDMRDNMNQDMGSEWNDDKRHGSKKSGIVKRGAMITAAAVLFGTVSGGVMTGVQYVGNRILSIYQASVSETTSPEVSAQAQGESETAQAGASGQDAMPISSVKNGSQGGVNDVSGIAEAVMPSVVAINDTMTIQQRDLFGFPLSYEAKSSGSGIIVEKSDEELLIATNNHVVDGATELSVVFCDDQAVDAAVKGTDSAADLAIIAVNLSDIPAETMSKIKVASLGDSEQIKVGQQAVAIGNALGYGQSVTVGYISALNRKITGDNGIEQEMIQTDAAINPGNSGGALLDTNGNVIGINVAKTAATEVEGMGYAIPINKAREVLNTLMTRQTRQEVAKEEQGALGIRVTNIDAETSKAYGMPIGVYVYQIMEGGAASQSELNEKDIITKFDGQSITNMEELTRMLTYYKSGSTVTLTVQSLVNGAYVEHEVQVTLQPKTEN